jgi:hypothetical protein
MEMTIFCAKKHIFGLSDNRPFNGSENGVSIWRIKNEIFGQKTIKFFATLFL